ncbi:translation initiation factor IF-3 [Candidatus Kapabacteria bacterium]|nr:translation initiation factor IF-3 [Candidatus Kapabacteria bacterium]
MLQILHAKFGGGGGFRGKRFQPRPQEKKHKTNHEIRGKEFRVIGPDSEMLGVMSKGQAIAKATEFGMDLIEIAPQAEPPVCKIMDYGKYIYEQQKKEKIQKKNQHKQQLKEIRFKPRTDTHDFNFKTNHAKDFLEEGNKVKGTVMFRGREITHKEIGMELLDKFIIALAEVSKVDNPMRMEGRNLTVILSPTKKK